MKISNDHVIFAMDKNNPPVAHCQNGETLIFQTLDCFSNSLKTTADTISHVDMDQVNPATGPVYVEGAQPGDTLRITIREINLADQGVTVAAPGFGKFADSITQEETQIGYLKKDYIEFLGHRLPYRKMIGVIGTAPAGDPVNTGTPADHGGNMDTTAICEGAILYLPVNVPGALLAMGDCHACMGDGEVIGAGLEIPAEITVTIEVLRDFDFPLPLLENDQQWITIASAKTMEEASTRAIQQMAELVQKISDLDHNQTAMLLSLAGDLKVSQVVNPQVTMRMELAKSVLQ